MEVKTIIRNEQKEDICTVEELICNAFWNIHVPGATEHFMAHQIRTHKDFVNELSMEAEIEGKIVGSIMIIKEKELVEL